jgi:hypothetical protein
MDVAFAWGLSPDSWAKETRASRAAMIARMRARVLIDYNLMLMNTPPKQGD